MTTKKLVTIKVTEDSRKMLRLLAAHSGTKLFEELENLLWQRMSKLKLTIKHYTPR